MNVTVQIRKAEEADLADVLALYAQPEIDDGQILPVSEAKKLFARFSDYPDYSLYVAELGGKVVGSFALLIMHNLGHLGAPSGVVEDVVVAPDLHGQGIGQAMMRFAIERCRDNDCYKVSLSANAKRSRAHAFYESLGFERHGYSFQVNLKDIAA
ncbi:MAG TPA: GNAT family N-acetyltransferase [Pseudorhodoplanes sp.]|nr:GNAT family N-acetyltransferase [Pseudorhodoplanes sp.]